MRAFAWESKVQLCPFCLRGPEQSPLTRGGWGVKKIGQHLDSEPNTARSGNRVKMVLNALPISGPHFSYLSNGIIIPVLPASQGCLIRGQAEQKELGVGTGHEFQPGSDSYLASGRPPPL